MNALFLKKNQQAFTLIEMVTVMVILGILSVGISSFLQFGARIYSETSEREHIMASARFVIARLNNEIRQALPNSLQVHNSGLCLKYTPIVVSSIYTDIPVLPDVMSNKIKVIRFDTSDFNNDLRVAVYPLSADEVYAEPNDKIYEINQILDNSGDVWTIELEDSVYFKNDSPTKRVFFIEQPVSYCLQGTSLYRNGLLMAQDIINADPFDVHQATLERNAMVVIRFVFERNGEQLVFVNEIQVANVP